MSDEQRNEETNEPEVEGHVHRVSANDEPTDEGDENEVEGHMRRATPRLDAPRAD
jgi:hypothetical protein